MKKDHGKRTAARRTRSKKGARPIKNRRAQAAHQGGHGSRGGGAGRHTAAERAQVADNSATATHALTHAVLQNENDAQNAIET